MCPFKHLRTSQLWTNQSPTGWSIRDGKVTSIEMWKHTAIIKIQNQTTILKGSMSSCIPPCSCTSGHLLPRRAKETSLRARLTTGLCHNYQHLHHAMKHPTSVLPYLLILCRYFRSALSSVKCQTGSKGNEKGKERNKCRCPLWHSGSPDGSLEQQGWFVSRALKSPAACDLCSRRAVAGCSSDMNAPWDACCWIAHSVSLENTTTD